MEEILALIERFGVTIGLLIWMMVRDYIFVRKIESVMDQLLAYFKGDRVA